MQIFDHLHFFGTKRLGERPWLFTGDLGIDIDIDFSLALGLSLRNPGGAGEARMLAIAVQ